VARGNATAQPGHGIIQPALTIWSVRDYHKRVWHLLQERRRERPELLERTLHMTNTVVLPVHSGKPAGQLGLNLVSCTGNSAMVTPKWPSRCVVNAAMVGRAGSGNTASSVAAATSRYS